MEFSHEYLVINRILLFSVITLSLYWGLWVYSKNPRERDNKLFFLLCISFIFWPMFGHLTFFSINKELIFIWIKMAYVSATIFLLIFYYFSLSFFGDYNKYKYLKYVINTATISLIFLSITTNLIVKDIKITNKGIEPIFGIGAYFFYGFSLFIFLFILYRFYINYISANKNQKEKIKYFFVGTLFLIILNIIFNILIPVVYGTYDFHQIGNYAPIVFIGFTAYAIIKKELFGIKIILTKLFVSLIGVILLFDLFILTDLLWMKVVKAITLIFYLFFAYSLIKTITKEMKQKKELEIITKKLEENNEKLLKLDKVKTEFVSIASHQLRTPLTAIKGYISMITEETYGKIPKEAKEKLENVALSNERLIKLVNDLLSVSRIETGKIELNLKKENIEKIISQTIYELKINAERKGLYLKFKKPNKKIPEIMVDEIKLRQVILNLIDNSIKYTINGGITIDINNHKEGKDVIIKIVDTGEGMDQEELSKVFASFSRGQAGNQLSAEGAGLGLFVARKFVEMHGGIVWSKSKGKGKGSQFYIKLPIK